MSEENRDDILNYVLNYLKGQLKLDHDLTWGGPHYTDRILTITLVLDGSPLTSTQVKLDDP